MDVSRQLTLRPHDSTLQTGWAPSRRNLSRVFQNMCTQMNSQMTNAWRGSNGLLLDFIISAHWRQWLQLARLSRAVIQDDMFSVHGGPCFKYHKANRTITDLYLGGNVIGNEGACVYWLGRSRRRLRRIWPQVRTPCSSGHDGNSFARFSPEILHALLTFGTAIL